MSTIRKATVEDATGLARIAEITFRAAFGSHNSPEDMDLHCDRNFGPELQLKEIEDNAMVTLLCEVEGQLAGFAQVCWKETPGSLPPGTNPGELRRIYVLERFHGAGVAQALMNASVKEIEDRESDLVWLGVWEYNPRAIAFYKKLGFYESGEHEFYLGNDLQRDIIMARST